jgi:hypothetical protein
VFTGYPAQTATFLAKKSNPVIFWNQAPVADQELEELEALIRKYRIQKGEIQSLNSTWRVYVRGFHHERRGLLAVHMGEIRLKDFDVSGLLNLGLAAAANMKDRAAYNWLATLFCKPPKDVNWF